MDIIYHAAENFNPFLKNFQTANCPGKRKARDECRALSISDCFYELIASFRTLCGTVTLVFP